MTPHYKNFDFKLTSDAKIQPVIQKCKQGRQILFSLLTIVTRWSRSTSNCYAMIGQNLTGEFMRKIYAASCNLFTDQLKLTEFCVCDVFNVFFHWMYKMKYSCYKESSVINGGFVY